MIMRSLLLPCRNGHDMFEQAPAPGRRAAMTTRGPTMLVSECGSRWPEGGLVGTRDLTSKTDESIAGQGRVENFKWVPVPRGHRTDRGLPKARHDWSIA